MNVMLDMIGSSIIAALLMLTMVRMNANSRETAAFFTEDLVVQENLHQFVKIVEDDFRKLGYGIAISGGGNMPMGFIIVSATDTSITYISDLNIDGAFDSTFYWLGGKDLVSDNPKDRILWRRTTLSGQASKPAIHICSGVIDFRLAYFGLAGVQLTTPVALNQKGQIQVIRITVNLQSPFLTQSQYDTDSIGYMKRSALWRESRLVARNYSR